MRVLTTIAIVIFLSLTTNGQNTNDKEAVKKVIVAFQEDFNDGGFKNAAVYSTSDWVHINPGGGIKIGRDSVLSEVVAVHQTFLKGVTMTMQNIDIRFITPDVAIANVIHKVDTYITPDGTKHENERHIKTYVLVKKNGKWLLTQDQNTIVMGSNTTSNQK